MRSSLVSAIAQVGFVVFLSAACLAPAAPAEEFSRIKIVEGDGADEVERNVAALLADRLREKGVSAEVTREPGAATLEPGLTILLGQASHHTALRRMLAETRVVPPTANDPGAEGYMLKTVVSGRTGTMAAVGTDDRGVLYAAGEILRRSAGYGSVRFSSSAEFRSAPAFRWRGTEVSQSVTMVELTHVAPWTEDRWRRVALDYALAGANILNAGTQERFAFLRSYGLMAHGGFFPNSLSGHPEWAAVEPIGRAGYVCLSIPEARAAVLSAIEGACRTGLPYDVMRLASGDPGGCWCDRCRPWGKTYIRMCEDIAHIIHKYNPGAKVFATNQELDNAGDRAIFDYFNQTPPSELSGLFYGPGGNAMSWNGTKRPDHRMDLFDHPAFGVYDRYVREIVHDLPERQELTFFTDLTHWFASQYGFLASWPMADFKGDTPPHWDFDVYNQIPDPALLAVYNRRTFYVRPRAYYHIFQETERYGEGDITYSEGHHDQFNQWIWQRLLWDPHMSVDGVVNEYCRTWFGPEAAPDMARAIFQLEDNLTAPVEGNGGIDTYLELVKKAGEKIPSALKSRDYLWRMHMQKALTDKYIQLRLQRQRAIQTRVCLRFDAALQDGGYDAAVTYARRQFDLASESKRMAQLRARAGLLGDESGALFGVRNEGYFKLDQDLAGLGWTTRQVEAVAAAPLARKHEIARLIARYEDPGEGGYYDDCGNPLRSPHMTKGWPYSCNNLLAGTVSMGNLPSQRTMAYTTDDKQGVTFEYHALDKAARYRVRLAVVRPKFLPRYASRHPENKESIVADGKTLVKDMEVPETDATLVEFDIPQECTADGDLTIGLEPSHPGPMDQAEADIKVWKRTGGWGTIVSDIWLMKAPESAGTAR